MVLVEAILEPRGMGTFWVGQWIALGPIMAECFSRSWSVTKAMAISVALSLGLQGGVVAIWSLQSGVAPWSLLQQGLEKAIEEAFMLSQQRDPSEEALLRAKASVLAAARAILKVLPGLFASMDLLLYWFNLLVQRRFPSLWRGGVPGPGNLDQWGIPFPWVWITILGGMLALLPIEPLNTMGLNGILVMGSVHLLQGLAVMAAVFRKRQVPTFLRGLIYGAVFLQQILTLAVALVGVFDVWFDFRRRLGAREVSQ